MRYPEAAHLLVSLEYFSLCGSIRGCFEPTKGKGVMNIAFGSRKFFSLGVLFLMSCVSMTGCANLNDPNPYGYGGPYGAPAPAPYYGAPYYGGGGYYGNDPYYRREQRDLERERKQLEDERRRLEREREFQNRPPPPPPSRPAPERCPPGFSPSERKCTPEERRRGCRDMRLPGGLGCVDRR